MNINDILDSLGLDLSNPETKRGALEAIDAILESRMPSGFSGGGGTGSNDPEEIEIDPDLIQPSIKHSDSSDDEDFEIEDEENLLDQVKHNDSDSDFSNDSADDENEGSEEETSSADNDSDKEGSNNNDTAASEDTNSTEETDDLENHENGETSEDEAEQGEQTEGEENSGSAEPGDSENPTDEENEKEIEDTDSDFDEADILDDEARKLFTDNDIQSKHEARKIKRERTLQAAKKALSDAQNRKVSAALIHELESAIAALEGLAEAVSKNIKDISDDEFNLLINRVFDAIEAVGDSSLTFTSEEERTVKAQEIKNDLSDSRTQAELSAEDVAKIRAENQAVKARDQEANKYKARSRHSFKGFQDFLNSLYRAIALQVHTEEAQDDTWSALNRRHSGSGVLQPGKRINELPNKKIPIIDFYFDQSGSWNEQDIAAGKKAIEALADMEEQGQIKINIYYFANHVHTDAATARAERGTRAWNDIVKNVISTQATNVIVMTDSDMEDWWEGPDALSYTVPGYVWYLWRDGDNAPRLPRDLKGRGGTQQFSFNRGDV